MSRPPNTHFLFDRGHSYEAGSSQVACGGNGSDAKHRTRDREAVTCAHCLEAIRVQEDQSNRRKAELLKNVERNARLALLGPDDRFHEEKSPEPTASILTARAASAAPRPYRGKAIRELA